jgi:hypothetical protein
LAGREAGCRDLVGGEVKSREEFLRIMAEERRLLYESAITRTHGAF